MIYTVTFNPAIDYVMYFNEINPGFVNRSEKEAVYAGGKGINVSIMLKRLGKASEALGFVAGFTGEAIIDELNKMSIANDFVKLNNGISRINVKLKENKETDLNSSGPEISKEDFETFLLKLDKLKHGDSIVLSGSLSKGMPENAYEQILQRLDGKYITTIVDTAGKNLLNTLKYKPFLIKPNIDELAEMLNITINGIDDVISGAKALRSLGAKNVLVSMGKDGALLLTEKGLVYKAKAPEGIAVNAVGAGDSMVAGYLFANLLGYDLSSNLRFAVACGSATAFSEGIATKCEISDALEKTMHPVLIERNEE